MGRIIKFKGEYRKLKNCWVPDIKQNVIALYTPTWRKDNLVKCADRLISGISLQGDFTPAKNRHIDIKEYIKLLDKNS